MIIDIKIETGKCKKCGWSKHPEILQFHHRKEETKLFKLSDGNFSNRNWDRILEEIKKCDLLCPNCHFWHHYKITATRTK